MKQIGDILEESFNDLYTRSQTIQGESQAATPDGRLPDDVSEEELPKVSQVSEADGPPTTASQKSNQTTTYWIPVGRSQLEALMPTPDYLRTYLYLVDLRRWREWWTDNGGEYVYHRGYGFYGLDCDTVPFDLEVLAARLEVPKDQVKLNLITLCKAGYLDLVLLEAQEDPSDGQWVGEEPWRYIEGWEFDGGWPVSAIRLTLAKSNFARIPEEIIDLPAQEIAFISSLHLRARHTHRKKKIYYKHKFYEVG